MQDVGARQSSCRFERGSVFQAGERRCLPRVNVLAQDCHGLCQSCRFGGEPRKANRYGARAGAGGECGEAGDVHACRGQVVLCDCVRELTQEEWIAGRLVPAGGAEGVVDGV